MSSYNCGLTFELDLSHYLIRYYMDTVTNYAQPHVSDLLWWVLVDCAKVVNEGKTRIQLNLPYPAIIRLINELKELHNSDVIADLSLVSRKAAYSILNNFIDQLTQILETI